MADDLDGIGQALSKFLKARAATHAHPREPSTVANVAFGGRRHSAPNDIQVLFGAVTLLAVVAVSLSVFFARAPGAPSPTAGQAGSAALSASASPVEASSPSNGQSLGGLVVELPDGWQVQRRTAIASMSSLVGYLTTIDVGEPCSSTDSTETCDLTPYDLEPDSAVIAVQTGGNPGVDPLASPPAGAVPSTIDGMPAYRLEEPATAGRADRVVTWVIARPGTIRNFYRLTAEIRGPSVSELSATVDEIVGGLHFADKVKTLPSDIGARDRAAAAGLADLERQSSAYACVPRASGEVGHGATDSLPILPSTDGTIEVACSYSIEPSPRQLWRMAVRFEWDAAGSRPAGALDVVAWLNPDGSVAGTEATIEP